MIDRETMIRMLRYEEAGPKELTKPCTVFWSLCARKEMLRFFG